GEAGLWLRGEEPAGAEAEREPPGHGLVDREAAHVGAAREPGVRADAERCPAVVAHRPYEPEREGGSGTERGECDELRGPVAGRSREPPPDVRRPGGGWVAERARQPERGAQGGAERDAFRGSGGRQGGERRARPHGRGERGQRRDHPGKEEVREVGTSQRAGSRSGATAAGGLHQATSIRASVSQNARSPAPITCCTTALREPTFHSARPRHSRDTSSASVAVSPSSDRASGTWSLDCRKTMRVWV